MRLIDADAFIEDIKTEIVNLAMDGMKGTPRSREELYQIIERIGEQPTAYNVEAKVAELEKESFHDDCGRAILLSDAERIVRGKDKCSTCQYSSGHVSTCMLKSSVCYYERRIVRGKE